MLGFLLQRLELLLLAVVQHVLFFPCQVLADLFISSVGEASYVLIVR